MRIVCLAFLTLLPLFPASLSAQVISIADARQKAPGSTVTVRGVVTNGPELGKIRFMQDVTAGIGAYPGAGSAAGFEAAVGPGDSIEVSGTLVFFHGLLEISPISAYSVIVKGGPLPTPKNVRLSDLSDQLEGRLLGIECVVLAAGGNFASGSYTLHDADGAAGELFLNNGNPLIGEPVPGTPFYLIALLSDYDGLQLQPRNADDFSATLCFYYTIPQVQTEIGTDAFRLSWQTNLYATSVIHYGNTPAMDQNIVVPDNTNNHSVLLTGLQPGSVYWTQIESNHNGNVIFSPVRTFATGSLSSGQIKVYFNHATDTGSMWPYQPDGASSAAVLAETIARINAAEQTVDVAMYNNSRNDITIALKNAHARGVRVRYVAALDAASTALDPPPPFPVIYGNADAIMHDKFLVIDADLPDKSWVMSGSMNWTNQNINTDFNNTLFIQDQSLARAYRLEFEEMWGGTGDFPDEQMARFGASKQDNTPHEFIIGGKKVFSWFSPSDRTTSHIVEAVYNAQQDIRFALFSFTNNEIGDALVDAFNNHVAVRGMMENTGDPGAEIQYLQSIGIDCRAHPIAGDLHHKYGVLDAGGEDPVVITGSHNWTFAAENSNDENTLIIHDERLAWLYLSEWTKRWNEISVAVSNPKDEAWQLYPNPASWKIGLEADGELVESIAVFNALGELLHCQVQYGPYCYIDIETLAPGPYYLQIQTIHGRTALPFQKI